MSSSVLKCISSALIQSLHSFSISDLFTQEYNPHSQEIYNLVGDCHRYCGFSSVQFSSVAQSCLTLCDPMSRSTPGLPVHHQLPESTQTHVHWVGDAIKLKKVLLLFFTEVTSFLILMAHAPSRWLRWDSSRSKPISGKQGVCGASDSILIKKTQREAGSRGFWERLLHWYKET